MLLLSFSNPPLVCLIQAHLYFFLLLFPSFLPHCKLKQRAAFVCVCDIVLINKYFLDSVILCICLCDCGSSLDFSNIFSSQLAYRGLVIKPAIFYAIYFETGAQLNVKEPKNAMATTHFQRVNNSVTEKISD